MGMEMEVTALSTLKTYAEGQLVQLPDFAEGQPFVAKLKRPSILAMTKSGKIPNELLAAVFKLFSGEGSKKEDGRDINMLIQMDEMLDVVCDAAFVSPTYQEIKDAGLELTDEQKSFVFQYAQNGVKALNNFRSE